MGDFKLQEEYLLLRSACVEVDEKIVILSGEIARLEAELRKPGSNIQKLTDQIHTLKAARMIRLAELERTFPLKEGR
jgi:hypothetical protein